MYDFYKMVKVFCIWSKTDIIHYKALFYAKTQDEVDSSNEYSKFSYNLFHLISDELYKYDNTPFTISAK